jgi:superfamily II DNA or RNA helicase
MQTFIGSQIEITDPSREILDWAKSRLILDNPEYKQLMLMGKERLIKWQHIPEKLYLYAQKGNRLILPFGLLKSVWRFIKDSPFDTGFNNAGEISIKDCKPTSPLYDYQETAVKAIIAAKGGVLVAPCGAGKGLPLDAKIYTPDGWKRNGDLVIGDKVIGSDGKETTVTGIFDKGEVPAYKLTFTDKTEIICDKDHLWAVQSQEARSYERGFQIKTATELYEYYNSIDKKSKELYIPIVQPVQFNPKPVTINPWLLGVLLGDGSLKKKEVTLSATEKDIILKVKSLTTDKLNQRDKYSFSFVGGEILNHIRKMGLNGCTFEKKYIPNDYKYNSIEVRLAVLQGLFDTDGTIYNGTYSYSTSSLQLANDFLEIVESLGGTGKINPRITSHLYKGEIRYSKLNYRIEFKLYLFVPFTSEKHLSKYIKRKKYKTAYRKIISVNEVAPIISRCITVDAKDELYVTDHFIITHNTRMGIETIHRIGRKALWLCMTGDLLRQAKRDMEELYPSIKIGLTTEGKLEIGEDVTISTVQTLSRIDPALYKNEFDVIICDECAHVCSFPSKLQMFGKVLSNIPARIKIGLTATPSRSDAGMIRAMYAYIGADNKGEFAPTYKVDRSLVKTIQAVHEKVELQNGYDNVENMLDIYDSSGMIIYNDLITALSDDNDRTDKIIDNVVKCDLDGRKQVVLALRVEHCKVIVEKLLERGVKAVLCTGAVTAKRRNEILTGKVDWQCLVATYSLLKEGVSIKELDTLHLATPIKEKAMIVQSVGRIERYMENKKQPIVYDYVDMDIPYCIKAYDARRRALKTRF